MGNREERVEREECTIKYFIASGKVGGIVGKSADVNPPAEQHEGELSGFINMIEDTIPINNCTARDFVNGSGADFEKAMISFSPNSDNMCSSTFKGNMSELNQAQTPEGSFTPITLSVTTSAGKICTYNYEVLSGDVLGMGASGDEEGNAKGRTVAAVIVSVFFLFAFFVPSCMPDKKRTYNAVP